MFQTLAAVVLVASTLHAQSGGWAIQSSPTTNNLFGVAFSDSSTWIAVGDAGTLLRSTNNGVDWTAVSVPTADDLRAVSFYADIGLAVGFAGRVLRTTDRGLNWVSVTRPTTRVLFASSMGNQMAVIGGEEGQVFVSTDSGVHWTVHLAGTAATVLSLSVNGDLGFGSGSQGTIWISGTLGTVWGFTVIGLPTVLFYGVSFATTRIGWTVGTSPTLASIVARSNSGGFTWGSQISPANQSLFGVSAVDTSLVFAVGANGTIIHTSDGGNAWTQQPSGTTQTLYSVSFANPRLGIAVGTGGTILRTTTGGLTAVNENTNAGLQIPNLFRLEQNYPNPFNPYTTIRYALPHASFVTLTVYNMLGQQVAQLVNEQQQPGYHEAVFHGDDLATGVYFYRLEAGSYTNVKSLLLLR